MVLKQLIAQLEFRSENGPNRRRATAEMNGWYNAREHAMNVVYFLGHLIVSTFGVVIVASILRYSIVISLREFFPSLSPRIGEWILMETPYFPVQILIGLLWGYKLGRRYGHNVMLWTWVVPALGIALLIRFAQLSAVVVSGVELTRTQHFFGWGCLPQNHCYDQTGYTLLLYAAAAYSLGALLARVAKRAKAGGPNSYRFESK
jgi:hypothetical protein